MNNYWRKMAHFSRSKGPAIILCATMLGTALPLPNAANATPVSSNFFTPIVNKDIPWIKPSSDSTAPFGAAIEHHSSRISLDASVLFSGVAGLSQLTASSSDSAVATANAYQLYTELEIISAGTTTITLEAQTPTLEKLTEQFQLTVTRIGDTTGDGIVTAADALYIMKVVNSGAVLTPEEINLLDINRDGVVTAADATKLLSSYAGKGSSAASSNYIITLSSINDAPVLHGALLAGLLKAGEMMTLQYDYFDAENDAEAASRFQWYRGTQADGSDRTAIAGATSPAYPVASEDVGYYLFVEATPVAAAGTTDGQSFLLATSTVVPDTSAPYIQSRVPAHSAGDISVAADLELTMNKPVTAVSGKKIYITNAANPLDVLAYDADDASHIIIDGKNISIKHADLGSETSYSVTIDAGAFIDQAGNAFEGISSSSAWSFTTADVTAPLLVQTSPANQEPNYALSAEPSLSFNEDIVPVTGKKITIRQASDDTIVQTYIVSESEQVTIQGGKAILHPSSQLVQFTSITAYYVEVEEGAFTDVHGNAFAGISDDAVWTFLTADARTLTAVDLEDLTEDQLRASSGAIFTVTLEEDTFEMAADTSDFELNHAPPGMTILSVIPLSANEIWLSVDYDGTDFDTDITNFSITAKASALTSGRALTTADMLIGATNELDITSLSPASQAMDVSKDLTLSLTFNRPVLATAGHTLTVYKASDDSIAASVALDDSTKVTFNGNTAEVQISGLSGATAYYVKVAAGSFQDSNGLASPGITSKTQWTFTTVADAPPFTTSPVYISEFLLQDENRAAVEIYSNSNNLTGYSLFVYGRSSTNGQYYEKELALPQLTPNGVTVIIDTAWYDFFYLTNAFYYNLEEKLAPEWGFIVSGIALKNNDVVVDVAGDISSNGALTSTLFPSGGTMVRKSGEIGKSLYDTSQWSYYPNETYQYMGHHTP
ncbi:Ig-like domain-containing protein [Paenibacillus algorifonticola]|uniref:Ig-like domain-containing protein n=1 Tax=Paenibacillus algorifonticola TaxID=684063 RepID=UPI003D299319